MRTPLVPVLLVAVLLAACSPSSQTGAPQTPEQEPTITVVAFGDSLTEGYGIPKEDAYPAQLERALRDRGIAARVVNAGVSGETSGGARERVGWVLRSDPDIVILCSGANDGLRGLPVENTRANLAETIEELKAAGVTVVLAGMIAPENNGEDYTEAFAAMYPALAEEYALPFVPFLLDGVVADPALNIEDEIHPNAEGYAIVVERNILPVLLPLLEGRD